MNYLKMISFIIYYYYTSPTSRKNEQPLLNLTDKVICDLCLYSCEQTIHCTFLFFVNTGEHFSVISLVLSSSPSYHLNVIVMGVSNAI